MNPGTTIANRYTINREIGRGSFGIVYLADDAHTHEQRAIKVLLPWAARNEQLRHRLRREARLAGSLNGPHAVRIYEAGETEAGDVFLAMEYLQGQELTEALKQSRSLPPDRVLHIARQVLEALEEAHKLGVIHRDLKPSNIFLCRAADGSEQVKVFDFGIAKVTGDGQLMATAKLSVAGGLMGTPVYMSPEQCRGEELTAAADFYSLGIVLYELLTGRVPFDDDNPVRVLLMHNHDEPPPLPAPIAQTPLGRAVMRAMAKDPHERFTSAREFLDCLAGKEIPQSALPRATVQPTALDPAAKLSVPSTATEALKPAETSEQSEPAAAAGSWVVWLVLTGLAIATIGGLAGWYFLGP
jgi:serine/threonine-protein kinase